MPRTYSSVAITAGSGTSVDTVQTSADSDHRQIVVVGDPDTDTFLQGVDSLGRALVTLLDSIATGSITTQNLNPTSGAATAASTVVTPDLDAAGVIAIQVTGTYTGVLSLQASVDGANWVTVATPSLFNVATGAAVNAIPSAAVGIWQADAAGYELMRVSALAAVTGTAVVSLQISLGSSVVSVDTPLPAGTSLIGGTTPSPSAAQTGLTPFFNNALLATVTSVKSSAGKVHGWHLYNPNTSDIWVQFFDLATGSVTLGTTTPKKSVWVPALGSSDYESTLGVGFLVAISIAATTTSTGLTAPTTGVVTNMDSI